MAEFMTVANERKRMCDSYERCLDGCPLSNALVDETCSAWILENPALAEVTIMKWAAEHPLITNGMKFREVFGEDMMAMLTGEYAQLDDWLDAEYKGGHGETD